MTLPLLLGISGMVKIGINQFLVVHDAKCPDEPRLGVIDVRVDGPSYREVGIDKWPSSESLPHDLEGICAIPERSGEYLVVESGFEPKCGHFGRVIKIGYGGGSASSAEYLGAFRPFPPPPNNSATPRHEQIEGIASVAHNGTTALLIALRGHKTTPGKLVWGTLDGLDKPDQVFREVGRHPLSPRAIADRGAADLFARAVLVNAWEILSVASLDAGDLGPFRSSVYSAGIITISCGTIVFIPYSTCGVLWDIEGLKVEALAASAELIPKSGLSIATDDEFYKGIWRPILESTGPQPPSPMLFFDNVRALSGVKLA
jgi:hypothetical protein